MNTDLKELYAGSWGDFVTRRSQLVAAARKEGDPGAADAFKRLRKPTRGAWLVNLVARYEDAQVDQLLRLGEELARAHRDFEPADMRRLSGMRSAAVNSLAGRAMALGAERGYAAPDSVRQEVAETLQAAMADPELADRVREGTIDTTVRAAGFGPADVHSGFTGGGAPGSPVDVGARVIELRPGSSAAVPGAVGAIRDQAAEERRPAEAAEVRRLSRDLGRAEARLEENEARLRRAEGAVAHARSCLTAAREQADECGVRVAALKTQLAAAEAQWRSADDEVVQAAATATRRASEHDLVTEEDVRLRKAIEATKARLIELGVEA